MADCALAADTKVETPEGAMTVKSVAGKAVSVFTREAGRLRFRMMRDVRRIAEQQPVVRITLDNGHTFRVGREQVFYRRGGGECRADVLRPGDELVAAFSFPEGYCFRDDATGEERVSGAAWKVTAVEGGGNADLYALGVNRSDCFMIAAGVLCKAE